VPGVTVDNNNKKKIPGPQRLRNGTVCLNCPDDHMSTRRNWHRIMVTLFVLTFGANKLSFFLTPTTLNMSFIATRSTTSKARRDGRTIRDECVALFAAGRETTASALSWTLYLLAKYPATAKKLAERTALVPSVPASAV